MDSPSPAIKKAIKGASIFLSEKGQFSLATAIFDNHEREGYWLEKITTELSQKNASPLIIAIEPGPDASLYSEIEKSLQQVENSIGHDVAIIVTGLSQHLDREDEKGKNLSESLFNQANLDRELFPKEFPYPILLCLNIGSQRSFLRNAPDLAHWCIHHFQFSEGVDQNLLQEKPHQQALESSSPGRTYTSHSDLTASEKIFREGLRATTAIYGPEHPDAILARANLANSLCQNGQLEEALALAKENSQLFEKSSIKGSYSKANALSMESFILRQSGNYQAAEPLARAALGLAEDSFGKDHPNVATGLNNLAQLLKATNRLDEAEPLMRRALLIDETSFGPEHPNVARDLNNLALLLKATNRLDEAEPLMRRALLIDEAPFGPEHPDVARDLNNLASLLLATNRLDEAEPLMRRALQIFRDSLGEEHPNTKIIAANLEILLKEMEK